MLFNGICLISDDVTRLANFYHELLGATIDGDDIHVFVKVDGLGFTIYSKQAAINDMGFDFSTYNGTGLFTLGFQVDDVDKEYEKVKKLKVDIILEPKTYPWGNRAMHFRDIDGNIVVFYKVVK